MDELILAIITIVFSSVIGAIAALITERYRSRLDNKSQFRGTQLPIYLEVWNSLYDLKLAADQLWKIANVEYLQRFVEQLKNTESKINRNILLIEENNKTELLKLIQTFWDFQVGKKTLIQLRERVVEDITNQMIQSIIDLNQQTKNEYEKLIGKIEQSFRERLRTK
ncbi:MAG: hypothetical protein MUO82_10055 [Candidatus Thermoplasmatota archaeon]|nr:hypothetical protein [Candidatus Thermoplasmatota archaeon]